MKKFLSAVTAAAMLTASTAGLSADAFWLPSRLWDAVTTDLTAPASSETPTAKPTDKPSETPTAKPTDKPSETPTAKPTDKPSETPTAEPTDKPTEVPTIKPTETPTEAPTQAPPKVSGISLNKTNLELRVGGTFELEAKLLPEGAEPEKIEWSVTDSGVTVKDGVVTAVSPCSAVVSAVTEKSKIVASCYVTVVDESGVLDLKVSEGVKEIVVTKDGLSTEVNAGKNILEYGTYSVSAKSELGYELNAYPDSVTVNKKSLTELEITAEKISCDIILPVAAGCTVTPINGSASPVQTNGSYSFTISYGAGYDASKAVVKANGIVITPENGVYTIKNITDDVTISIDGVAAKSWDTSLKSVTVKGKEAVLGANDVYTVTLPFGDMATTNDVVIVPTDNKASYTVITEGSDSLITVKAEDGTTKAYKLVINYKDATSFDEFRIKVEKLSHSDVTQSENGRYDTQDEIRADLEKSIAAIASSYTGFSYKVENGKMQAPIAGTVSNPEGSNGYYEYTITLIDNTAESGSTAEVETRTINLNIPIMSYKYTLSAGSITAAATTITVRNLTGSVEVCLFTEAGARLRAWETPINGTVTFSNLSGGSTYIVKVREYGSSEVPATGTMVTTKETTRHSTRYYVVRFDEGSHGTIVSGKTKQSVRLAGAPDYPTVQADDGYIFKGWSRSGVLIENPKSVQIRCDTTFIAIYEKSSGSSYGTSTSRPGSEVNAPVVSTPVKPVFRDVASSSWFYDSVVSICNKGYMNGVDSNTFAPDKTLTRAMLVTILYRFAYEPNVSGATGFYDVPGGQWYSNAVAWAADAGIVNGVAPGYFDPNANITREQFAAIIYRYAEAYGYDLSAAGNIIKYSDSARISDWAQKALIWTTGAGIIGGKDNNRLDPTGFATRAEAAAMLDRFDNHINK